jgi:uncharacterized membrane protein
MIRTTSSRRERVGRWTAVLRNATFVLVILVAVTGGVRQRVHIAGTDLLIDLANVGTVTAIFLFALALGIRFPGPGGLRQEWWFRQALRLHDAASRALQRRPLGFALTLAAGFALVIGAGAVRRHLTFGSSAYDLGVMYEPLRQTLHGRFYHSSLIGDLIRFGSHVEPIAFAFLPLLALWESPIVLLLVQAVALGLAIVPLTLLARRTLQSPTIQLAVVAAFVSFYPYRHPGLWDYHHVVLALPLLLAAIHALESGRRWTTAALIALALLTKETVALPVIGLGGVMLVRRRWRLGASLIVGAAAYFAFTAALPGWLGLPRLSLNQFSYLGDSMGDVALAAVRQPAKFWGQFLVPDAARYVAEMLGPVAFLPLLSPLELIPALPVFAYLALVEGSAKLTVKHHDASLIVPFVFYALVLGLARLERKLPERAAGPGRWWRSRASVAALLVATSLLFFGKSDVYRLREYRTTPRTQHVRDVLEHVVPPDAAVAASNCFVPHLLNRSRIYMIPRQPDDVEYLVFDGRDKFCRWPMSPDEQKRFPGTVDEAKYRRVHDVDGIIVWRRGTAAPPPPR